jgi:hypothetical protein
MISFCPDTTCGQLPPSTVKGGGAHRVRGIAGYVGETAVLRSCHARPAVREVIQ